MASAIREILQQAAPLLPVIVLDDAALAVDLAHELLAAGIRVLEITLRTPQALHAIQAIREACPDVVVGAGTVLTASQWQAACDMGAHFVVSPGLTPQLADIAHRLKTPFLPGVMTASEIMFAVEQGFETLKLFPAMGGQGIALLNSFSGPFSQVRFCPTGGLTAENYADYLRLPNVLCVGGSWLTPKEALNRRDWAHIAQLAQQIHGVSTCK